MKNTMKKLLCLILALCFTFTFIISCKKDEGDDDDEESDVEITLIFDYSEYEGVEWDEDFDEEMVVEANKKVGSFPKPKLDGYKFDGWYEDTEDPDTKLRTTTKYSGEETEITLYAKFKEDTGDDDDNGSTTYNCAKGVHNWKITTTPPTCTDAGKKLKVCQICNDEESDAIYSSQNPKLGHQWVEAGAIDDGGWSYIALARQRTCKREGCDYAETIQLENLTSNINSLTVSIDAGAWPGTAEWPAILTDNKWDGKAANQPDAAPKGGGPLTITMLFNKALDVDQLVICAKGLGEDGYSSKYKIFIWYADEATFPEGEESAKYPGELLSTHGTKATAACIDLSAEERPILGIKIVFPKTLHGSELFHEIAIARIPDEE